ncbi:MAG: polymer-forming cytoskeletal protein [Candidatus Saccharimonadales bacterium]
MVKKSIIGFVVALLAVGGFFASQASAVGLFVANDQGDAVVAADKTVDGSAYLAGKTVLVDGTIQGDLFCAGSDIIINGTVEGDVICAGSNVTLGGVVNGDVRLAGSNVTLKGSVGGSATVGGSAVNLNKGAIVAGDLTGAASTLVIDGTVGRDMLVGAGVATISGMVGRDVNASIETLTVASDAKIGGNVVYESKSESVIPSGVVVGETRYSMMKEDIGMSGASNPFIALLGGVVALIVLALLVTLVVPKYVHDAAAVPFKTVLVAFLAGFAGVVLTPMLAVLLMTTIVGIPAGLVILVAWSLFVALAAVFFAYYVGMAVLRKRATNALLVALVGSVVLGVALVIPVLNVLVFLAMIFVGVGLQVMNLRHQFTKKPYTIAG